MNVITVFTFIFMFTTGHTSLFREAEIKGFDSSLFKTEQIFYYSKDKTRVPMFVVSKKVRLVLLPRLTLSLRLPNLTEMAQFICTAMEDLISIFSQASRYFVLCMLA